MESTRNKRNIRYYLEGYAKACPRDFSLPVASSIIHGARQSQRIQKELAVV